MSSTTLASVFPRIDKICDAAFIKSALGTTKKDSVLFINDNEECHAFLAEKEGMIDRHNDIVRSDIMEFLKGEKMQLAIAKFKSAIKEKVAMDKASKKVLEKQAIIEEYLREQEQLKKDNEERAKLGMPPKKDPHTASTELADEAEAKSKPSSRDSGSESSEETQMNLDDFMNLFKAVYDQGHIMFKQGETVLRNVDIRMDAELQKIVVQAKPAPTISVKSK